MMPSTVDLRLMLAIAALFLSFVTLFFAIFAVLYARTNFYKSADRVRANLGKTAGDVNAAYAQIQALQTGVSALAIRARLAGRLVGTASSKWPRRGVSAASAAATRYREFLRLLEDWSRLSSLRVQGAAASSREEIRGMLGSVPSSEGATAREERFAVCANSVVEYLVEATDATFQQDAPAAVDSALTRMVDLAGRELISPASGAAWDTALHDALGKVARGSHRPGTVAAVAIRGLRGGGRRVMKAKVFLYDD